MKYKAFGKTKPRSKKAVAKDDSKVTTEEEKAKDLLSKQSEKLEKEIKDVKEMRQGRVGNVLKMRSCCW